MNSYSLSHVSNGALLRDLATSGKQGRATPATMLAQIAEVDERKLFAGAGYESMFSYCVRELHMSGDVACKRIRAARAAREHPAIFQALADGRLHVSGVVLLAPHLTAGNGVELLAAAAHRTLAEIELLLAERFPRPDVPTLVQAIGAPSSGGAPTARMAVPSMEPELVACMGPLAGRPVVPTIEPSSGLIMGPVLAHAKLTPLSADRVGVQFSMRRTAYEQLCYAQALLGHAVPSADIGEVFERGLDSLVDELERHKFAKCARSGSRRSAGNGRYIPAEIRRAVWERDGGRCSFMSEHGRRCEARSRLEFDHVDPVARGGETTVDGLRLRCRTHNQYEAERTFGAGFMEAKREAAKLRAAEAKARKQAEAEARIRANEDLVRARAKEEASARSRAEAEDNPDQSVIPWLRTLGYTLERARHGAELCAHMGDAPLQERLKVALRGPSAHLGPRIPPGARKPRAIPAASAGSAPDLPLTASRAAAPARVPRSPARPCRPRARARRGSRAGPRAAQIGRAPWRGR